MIPPATARSTLNRVVSNLGAATDAARAAMTQFSMAMPHRVPTPSQVHTARHRIIEAQRLMKKSAEQLNQAAALIASYDERLADDDLPPAA